MNELVKKIRYLNNKAKYFQKLKDDEKFLYEEIEKISIDNVKYVQNLYINEDKIKKIRYEVGNLLLNKKFNKENFENLKQKINNQYDTNILQTWKDFSILYVFFFNPIKNIVNEYLEDIGNYFIENSGKKLKLKTTNFDGTRNLGDVGCWIALYNPKYNSQSDGIQYFMNFYDNNTTYGTYHHETKKDIDRKEYDIENLDENTIQSIIIDLRNQLNTILENENAGKDYMTNEKKQTQPLNQILYGSPGTGKTYNTINKALEIIFSQDKECGRTHEDLDKKFDINQNKKDDKCQYETIKKSYKEAFDQDDRNALKQIFEYYKEQGQIEFVTFHQSYGYEEFVEGIKAETNGENITYEVKAGIFKKLSNRANKNIEQSKENIIIKKEFDVVFKEKILDKLLDNDKLEIKMKKSSFYIKEVDETHISFDKTGGESQHVLLIKNLKLMYEQGENKIIMGGLSQYYNPLLEYLFENSEIKNEEKEPLKNYILIIDEINRGNISKIFGELITLIEDSKRLDKPEQIEITLPYSGQKFGVPQNLYIIGTMNTADRSIAPIDTALRRRFVFEEMAPNPSLLNSIIVKENIKLELDKLLEAINTRIEYLYDRDHTIGHAYLIDVKTLDDLKFAFKNKIIPLLAEYFYEDWENIDLVLNNNGFIKTKEDNNKYLAVVNKKISGKKIYEVSNENWGIENFIRIYNDNINLSKAIEDVKVDVISSDEN